MSETTVGEERRLRQEMAASAAPLVARRRWTSALRAHAGRKAGRGHDSGRQGDERKEGRQAGVREKERENKKERARQRQTGKQLQHGLPAFCGASDCGGWKDQSKHVGATPPPSFARGDFSQPVTLRAALEQTRKEPPQTRERNRDRCARRL